MDKQHATLKEYVDCVEQANSLIVHLGNPSNRVYSTVVSMRTVINEVNLWRSSIHDFFYQKEQSGEQITVQELEKLIEAYPENGLECDEREWVRELYSKERDITTKREE